MRANLSVKIFADGADIPTIQTLAVNPRIEGFTTNPTLMRKAGVSNYEAFAKDVLSIIGDRPISFEVFSDDFDEMRVQARKIALWGPNVYVKIPVTNTKAESSMSLIRSLTQEGIQVNVTAILTMDQVLQTREALAGGAPSYMSVFAGRIADTGVDPLPTLSLALDEIRSEEQIELIWASPRELLNLVQASQIKCHIITVTADLLEKITNIGKDLSQFSLETVAMFERDARNAGYAL